MIFGLGLFDGRLHLVGDEVRVVLVHRVADALALEVHHAVVGVEIVVRAVREALVDGVVDALDHRGQDRARLHVVLVAVDADAEDALVGRGLQHADAGAAGGGIDHVGALADLRAGQFGAA